MASFSLWDAILSGSPMGRNQMAIDRENMRRDELMAAAYQTGQLMPEGVQGPPQSAQYASGIVPEFAVRAAATPGYQQLGAQLLNTNAQQGLQQAERNWLANNETLNQRLSREEQAWQGEQGRALQRELGIGQLSNQRMYYDWQKQRAEAQDAIALAAAGGPQGAKPGSPLYDQQLKEYQAAVQGQKDVDALGALLKVDPSGWNRETKGRAQVIRQGIVSAIGKAAEAGALGNEEKAYYESLVPAPEFFSWDDVQKGKLAELAKRFISAQGYVLGRNPNLPRPQIPAGFDPEPAPAPREPVKQNPIWNRITPRTTDRNLYPSVR